MRLRGNHETPESGILLHISSLPSKYGIGTLGDEAYRFIDFLKQTGQRYWQMLPLVPLGEGNSPYKSPCCFAGEPLYIDLELLVRDGLLEAAELPEDFGDLKTDYQRVREVKMPLLKRAAERFNKKKSDYLKFLKQNDLEELKKQLSAMESKIEKLSKLSKLLGGEEAK